MAYDLEFVASAIGDIEQLVKHNPALAVQLMTEHFPLIARDPKAVGEKKRGDLAYVRAYGFTIRGVTYRIVYSVDDDAQCVSIVAFGAHDTAYRRARDR
jgi:mRNA-degrading endonuclease RelE of RelBE toxin-antitoxin system